MDELRRAAYRTGYLVPTIPYRTPEELRSHLTIDNLTTKALRLLANKNTGRKARKVDRGQLLLLVKDLEPPPLIMREPTDQEFIDLTFWPGYAATLSIADVNILVSTLRRVGTNKTFGPDDQCCNSDVKNPSFAYEEEGYTYCFSEDDLAVLLSDQLNPYTGKPISQEFLKTHGVTVFLPNPGSLCETKSILPDTLKDKGNGIIFYKARAIRIGLVRELAPYRPCTPRTVYRGLKLMKDSLLFEQLLPVKIGDSFEYDMITLSSWTTDLSVAESYALGSGGFGLGASTQRQIYDYNYASVILSTEATRDNVYIDGTINDFDGTWVSRLKEVRLLPWLFPVTVIKLYKQGETVTDIID